MKKQIEEMTKDLCDIECKGMKCNECDRYGCEYRVLAEALYNAGYRKQKEGEWIKSQFNSRCGFYEIKDFICSECKIYVSALASSFPMAYCPHCGEKMKGATDGKAD